MDDFTARARSTGSPVAADYQALHKYLDGRFADAVVLTFVQIEDLIGHALPGQAYSEPAWWADQSESGAVSPQATAWRRAHRAAQANLLARTVRFDRDDP